jgi:RimJ/RimL family protein N-acetyltransferase
MVELHPDQYSCARSVFKQMDTCIPLQGVLEKRHPARIFVDQFPNPTSAFVWDRWGYFYLAGYPGRQELSTAITKLLEEQLLPDSKALGQTGFILWPDSPDWKPVISNLLPGRIPSQIFRRTFSFDPATFHEWRYTRPQIPPGFTLKPMDRDLLERNPDVAFEVLSAWESLETYLRDGIGVCLMEGDTLASVCFSMFTGSRAAEANVFTVERFRQRGFATLTSAGFIDACLRRKLRPNWECFWDNLPSKKLAENLGFKAQEDKPVYYWEESSEYVNI